MRRKKGNFEKDRMVVGKEFRIKVDALMDV